MAGEKTEKATPKRREEARGKGQATKSPEINTAVVLLACFGTLALTAPRMLQRLENVVARGLAQSGDTHLATTDGLATLAAWAMRETALTLAPVLAAGVVAGVLANVAQVKFRITPKALAPSFKKLNPLSGVKRIFGPDGAVEAAKSVIKTVTIGGIAFLAIWPRLPEFAALVGLPPAALLSELASIVASIAWRVLAAYAVVATADWFWQRRKHEKSIRMTKEEVKQEGKQADVPPEVKRALRRRQMEQSRKRMLAEVPTADVVVVNPTHYAVALRYDGKTPAPEVVAKGVDLVAAAIRRVAEEHGVPIVHNAPLARALHAEVELNQMIPEALFTAVAEILAFVFRTSGRRRRTA